MFRLGRTVLHPFFYNSKWSPKYTSDILMRTTKLIRRTPHLSWRTPICHGGPDPPSRTPATCHGGLIHSSLLIRNSSMFGIPGQARNDNIVFRRLRANTNQHVVHFSCLIFYFFFKLPAKWLFWGLTPKTLCLEN